MSFKTDEIEIFKEIYTKMKSDFKQRIHVRDLVNQYRISQSTLTRGFHYHYNKTIPQHRLECCMEYAKKLLEDGKQVKAVSIELGYKTTGNFDRAFKNIYGYVPKSYQLQL